MPKTYDIIKEDFLWLQSRYWLWVGVVAWLEKVIIGFQISNELRNDVLNYMSLSFG